MVSAGWSTAAYSEKNTQHVAKRFSRLRDFKEDRALLDSSFSGLNTLDFFFLCGFLKDNVYLNHQQDLVELKKEIRRATKTIAQVTCQNVLANLAKCERRCV